MVLYPDSRGIRTIIELLKQDRSFKNKDLSKINLSKINLDKLIEIISPHLISIIYDKIKSNPYVLSKVKKEINKEITRWIKRRLFIDASFKGISKRFNKEKIQFILLKGLVLEKKIYSPHTRLFIDLDFLIKEKDLDKADNVLKELGYSSEKDIYPEDYYKEYKPHIVLINKQGNLKVELHTSLTETYAPFNIKSLDLFKDSKSLRINGLRTRVLCNEHIILHQCLHFVYVHAYDSPLISCYEISTFINKNEIDWKKLIRICKSTKASVFVYQAISISKKMFKSQAPKYVLKQLKDNSRKSTLIMLRLFYPRKSEKPSLVRYRLRKWMLKLLLTNKQYKKIYVLRDLFDSYKYQKKHKNHITNEKI